MKSIVSAIIGIALISSAPLACAGPYRTAVVKGTDGTYRIEVPARKAIVVTSFCHDSFTPANNKCQLVAMIGDKSMNVLQSTYAEGASPKDVVVAGPASVFFVPNGVTVFISYKIVAN